jgi:hypothetical protein
VLVVAVVAVALFFLKPFNPPGAVQLYTLIVVESALNTTTTTDLHY